MAHSWTRDVGGFLSALLRHWISKTLFLLGFGSTIATYISSFRPSFVVPRFVPVIFFATALVLGAFDLYREQWRQIEHLGLEISAFRSNEKRADLVLQIHEHSQFMRYAPERIYPPHGTYFHFRASVENKGIGRRSFRNIAFVSMSWALTKT
jgi:hypothetical protein